MELFRRFASVYDVVRPVLDMAILAFLFYQAYKLLVRTQALELMKGAGVLAVVYALAYILKLATLEWILRLLAPGLMMIVVIVFQPELRKFIIRMGQAEFFRPDRPPDLGRLEAVVTAAERLSQEKRGMLVVFPRRNSIRHIVETGTRLNADISSELVVTVFVFDTPLHDGAMVIQAGRIVAAGCYLPLSDRQDIRKSFGTRHRAALGMAEQSDAVILVVSEETGALSLAYDAKLDYDLEPLEVTRRLKELLDRGARSGGPAQAAVEAA